MNVGCFIKGERIKDIFNFYFMSWRLFSAMELKTKIQKPQEKQKILEITTKKQKTFCDFIIRSVNSLLNARVVFALYFWI